MSSDTVSPSGSVSSQQIQRHAGLDRVRAAFESGLKLRRNIPKDPREELVRYESAAVDFNDNATSDFVLQWWNVPLFLFYLDQI